MIVVYYNINSQQELYIVLCDKADNVIVDFYYIELNKKRLFSFQPVCVIVFFSIYKHLNYLILY